MKRFILLFTGLGMYTATFAQLPVQIFAGQESLEYNFLWFEDVDSAGKVSLFNFTFFNIDYQNSARNTYEIYQLATYNLNANWGIATGGRFTFGEFLPLLAVSYQIATDNFYFNIFPSAQYSFSGEEISYSVFGLLFYQPRINDTWKGFFQLSFEPFFTLEDHIFSYQQLRAGLEYKTLFQFGIGANIEQTGNNPTWNQNYGLFIRKDL